MARYAPCDNVMKPLLCITVDVEDWFHILDSNKVPSIEQWPQLESRVQGNLERLLDLFNSLQAKCTFFWLGWLAERNKKLVRLCQSEGHEVACHGYAHVLPQKVGREKFLEDIQCSKKILEDITGECVLGFRSPGFNITEESTWIFDVIKQAQYKYDTSVFPAHHGHGGIPGALLKPHFIKTNSGHLLEIPASVVELFRHRFSVFGGGYLRLATKPMIQWGLNRLNHAGQLSVVYVHPREIDPCQPRLPLSYIRRFKCYIRLQSTISKLEWLCRHHHVCRMLDIVDHYISDCYCRASTLPVVQICDNKEWDTDSLGHSREDRETLRSRLLQVEDAMATFLINDHDAGHGRYGEKPKPTGLETVSNYHDGII